MKIENDRETDPLLSSNRKTKNINGILLDIESRIRTTVIGIGIGIMNISGAVAISISQFNMQAPDTLIENPNCSRNHLSICSMDVKEINN